MASTAQDRQLPEIRATVPPANSGVPPMEVLEKMARRRHQAPKPERKGGWWTLRYRQDELRNGKLVRIQKRVILGPSTKSEREVQKIADEHLRPLNQGLETIGGAVNFNTFVQQHFLSLVMPQYAETTKDRYLGILGQYLMPAFGNLCLRDLTRMTLQRYFSGLADSPLSRESKDKIRDVLSTVLRSAKEFGLI